eukprot:m.82376 g.82376  ORF g.82376 m.82376 type:complete len:531 (-) comp14912_c0_seq2:234-1826(-)
MLCERLRAHAASLSSKGQTGHDRSSSNSSGGSAQSGKGLSAWTADELADVAAALQAKGVQPPSVLQPFAPQRSTTISTPTATPTTSAADASAAIPTFYRPRLGQTRKASASSASSSTAASSANAKLQELARELHLAHASRQVGSRADLDKLWQQLELCSDITTTAAPAISAANATTSVKSSKEDVRISYARFTECKAWVQQHTPALSVYFTPATYLMFEADAKGCISSTALFEYISQTVVFQQIRLGFCLFDSTGAGFVTEAQLERFIAQQVPSLPQLEDLEEDFRATYVVYACRKFLFFLDPLRSGRVRIDSLLLSEIFAEFLQLQEAKLPKKQLAANWFALPTLTRIHGQFMDLDVDGNGLLSLNEFINVDSGALSDAAVERVFQTCLTFGGELDYKGFLDFKLAQLQPLHARSLHYFFRLLDLDHKGRIDAFAIRFFWRSMLQHPTMQAMPIVRPEDIVNEVFDMIKPENPGFITLQDLLKSGKGDTVVGILTDVNKFIAYENRESQPPAPADGDGDGDGGDDGGDD